MLFLWYITLYQANVSDHQQNCLHSPFGVDDAFDNLPNGHILRGVHVSTEGTKVLGGALGTSYCSRRVRNDLK
jgi:hypothetical protein